MARLAFATPSAMLVVAAVLLVAGAAPAVALDNGVALTPPMGWMSWERFRCRINCTEYPDSCINEQLYMAMADKMVSDGYLAAGYDRVNIDDCWANHTRASDGSLQPNADRFPHGIKWLADYMHSRGLKLGIYGDVGTATCGGYPGSLGHFKQDAETFAAWGIDSVKLDGCNANTSDFATLYPAFGAALNATGRHIVYSCSWPAYIVGSKTIPTNYTQIAEYCNLWRNYDDIQDSFASMSHILGWFVDNQDKMVSAAGPGNWNNPDQLIIGDFGLSPAQAQMQMTSWSMLAAPLYMSNDLRTISSDYASILLNKEVIAVNQDPLGHQGERFKETSSEWWMYKQLADGSTALAILEFSDSIGSGKDITTVLSEVPGVGSAPVHVRDLWAGEDLGMMTSVTVRLAPYGTALLKLTPASQSK